MVPPLSLALVLATQLDGTPPGALEVPLASNRVCAYCHAAPAPATSPPPPTGLAGEDLRGSMMNLASYDPFFLAAWEIALEDDPALAAACVRCHAPIGVVSGKEPASLPERGGEGDLDGVACDVCHRFEAPPAGGDDPLSGVLRGNARFFLADDTTKRGPYGDAVGGNHRSAYSPLASDSRLCGQCHDVTNPLKERLTVEGSRTGDAMALERTFTEWSLSAYARDGEDAATCQRCHMPKLLARDARVAGLEVPERLVSNHRVVGSSVYAPLLVAAMGEAPDAPAFLRDIRPYAEATSSAAREMLAGAATLEARALVDTGAGPGLRVRVTNLSGHKLPTGYSEGRRMWIAAATRSADGACGRRTGTFDPATCELVPGEEPMVTWEVLLGEGSRGKSLHFASVDTILKDSRIPPRGFIPTPETAPVGRAFPENEDGALAHWDEVVLPLGQISAWPVDVEVVLYFQSTTRELLHFFVERAPRFGPLLADAWRQAGGAPPVEMTWLQVRVYEDGKLEALPPHGTPRQRSCLPDVERLVAAACLPADEGAVDESGADAGPRPALDGGGPATGAPGCACASPGKSAPLGLGLLALVAGLSSRRLRSRARGRVRGATRSA